MSTARARPIIRRSPSFRRWGRDAIREDCEDRKTQTRRVFGIGRRFYGEAGTIWYMGEPLERRLSHACYADDGVFPVLPAMAWRWKRDTLHGMYMPREAARTFLLVTAVRVEHLQEIVFSDFVQEGIPGDGVDMRAWGDRWRELWDAINAKRGFAFHTNPRVWVYTFRRLADITTLAEAEAYAARKD